MQKLVIDTNVFISYLISENRFSYKIADSLFTKKNVTHFVSIATLNEYFTVFNRKRFLKTNPDFLRISYLLYSNIVRSSIPVIPKKALDLIKDKNDNRFLEVAYAANADFLITGNKLHFTFTKFNNTQIVSPREYWENYKP